MKNPPSTLDDIKVHVKIKLSALWASVMFCYIYADYFGLWKPGTLQEMLSGKMGPSDRRPSGFCSERQS
jgi:hypothetical protein